MVPANPLDLTGSATDEHYSLATDKMVKIFNRAKTHIPIVTCIVGEAGYEKRVRSLLKGLKIPCYPTPEKAARGLRALRLRAKYLEMPKPPLVKLNDRNKVRWLDEHAKAGDFNRALFVHANVRIWHFLSQFSNG